jgi:glycine/D-amino acid oxidase-like deaminating enzyme
VKARVSVDFDVVIVGGGVMGSSTAYHLLAADGSLRVAVVERDPSYRYASTVLSDGNVRIQFNLEENIRMSQYTMEVLETFEADMAVADVRPVVGAKQQGNLFLADAAGRQASQDGMATQNRLGCGVEWLDADQIAAAFPAYASPTMVGGTLGRNDGSVDPSAVLRGYRSKAIDLGAEYLDAEVVSLVADGERIGGVLVGDGTVVSAPAVVNCAGAWASKLVETVGVDLPIKPVMRTVYVVAAGVETAGLPSVFLPSGVYAIPEGEGGRWLIAWSLPDDPVGFEFVPASRSRFTDRIWPELVSHLPAFDALHVESSWAGLYAVNTLDGNAIVGEWPRLRGLYLANGFSGHGFQHGPAVGRYLSELILGKPPALDLSRLGPQRILDGTPVYEHAGRII